jgi:hypothetical protein
MLALRAVPGSAARSQPSDLSSAAVHRLGAEMRLSPSPECDSDPQWSPEVAYNPTHKEYLVVWYNEWGGAEDKDIYARRVSEGGQVLSWFSVATGLNGGDGKNRFMPSVAYNAANDEYLVVWQYEVGSGVYEIWGRRIPWDGPGSYPEFLIIAWANRSFSEPRVAWNSVRNEYLVIWNATDTTTWQYSDVAGYRVSANGVVQNPGMPIIITTSDQPHEADLVYSAALNGYMVAWTRIDATTGYDIYGAFLDPDGAKITPPGEFPIYAGPSVQGSPAVTADDENHYMVVWSDDHSGDPDIYGQIFQADGSPITGPFAIANTTDTEVWPDVTAIADSQYLAVWSRLVSGGSSVVARLRSSGTLAAPVDIAAQASWEAWAPAVACDVPGCLIAYANRPPSEYGHIYGRLYWPQAVYLPLVLR